MIKRILNIALVITICYLAYEIYSTDSKISEIEKKMDNLKCKKPIK